MQEEEPHRVVLCTNTEKKDCISITTTYYTNGDVDNTYGLIDDLGVESYLMSPDEILKIAKQKIHDYDANAKYSISQILEVSKAIINANKTKIVCDYMNHSRTLRRRDTNITNVNFNTGDIGYRDDNNKLIILNVFKEMGIKPLL